MSFASSCFLGIGFSQLRKAPYYVVASCFPRAVRSSLKFSDTERRIISRTTLPSIASAVDDSLHVTSIDDGDVSDGIYGGSFYILTSSDSEQSDSEFVINPSRDCELSPGKDHVDNYDSSLTITVKRFASLQKRSSVNRIQSGVSINMVLTAFLIWLLLLVDYCAWHIIRKPLPSFYLTQPFLISAVLALFAGYLFIPLFNYLKFHRNCKKEKPKTTQSIKDGIPSMGGLFFIPIGIAVPTIITGFSTEVCGSAMATLAFAFIGMLDDTIGLFKKHNCDMTWIKLLIQVFVGAYFSFWLCSTNITSPYNMKLLVPLPSPIGLVYLGKLYFFVTTFCFVAMTNGVKLTDGLHGSAGGIAALAFVAMSIAALPICPDLAIFGASMAGACLGFLGHNRFNASIFMGDTGTLALGGALASMAALTGMFFPLFITSGVFVVNALSVIIQVLFFKVTKSLYGSGQSFFRIAPFHHCLKLNGFKEPQIVAMAYIMTFFLTLSAAYTGLTSA